MKYFVWLIAVVAFGFFLNSNVSAQAADVATTTVAAANQVTEYRLPPELLAKSEALYRTRVAMFAISAIYGFALLFVVLALRIAPRIRDWAERASQRRIVQVLIFAPLFLLFIDALTLPLGIYGQHLQLEYGLSVQTWGSWFWDWTMGEVIGTAIGTLLVFGLYTFFRRSPTRWWLYGWLTMIPFILLIVLIKPIFIDPLFNTFEPLEAKQPALVERLEQVMARGGLSIERSRMFEMQASEKVTTYNAYVTGIGASKRVVVWDNTSRDLSIPETMFVFGHEQGHYVLDHIWKLLAFAIGGLLIAMYVGYRTIGGVLSKFGARWGIRELSDWASLPALLLLFTLFSFLAQPVSATFSRMLEHQADVYGLEVIHDLVPDSPQVAARAFQKLGEKGLAYPDPSPLLVFWVFDHPPVDERLKFAAEYRPWDHGEANRFVK